MALLFLTWPLKEPILATTEHSSSLSRFSELSQRSEIFPLSYQLRGIAVTIADHYLNKD